MLIDVDVWPVVTSADAPTGQNPIIICEPVIQFACEFTGSGNRFATHSKGNQSGLDKYFYSSHY